MTEQAEGYRIRRKKIGLLGRTKEFDIPISAFKSQNSILSFIDKDTDLNSSYQYEIAAYYSIGKRKVLSKFTPPQDIHLKTLAAGVKDLKALFDPTIEEKLEPLLKTNYTLFETYMKGSKGYKKIAEKIIHLEKLHSMHAAETNKTVKIFELRSDLTTSLKIIDDLTADLEKTGTSLSELLHDLVDFKKTIDLPFNEGDRASHLMNYVTGITLPDLLRYKNIQELLEKLIKYLAIREKISDAFRLSHEVHSYLTSLKTEDGDMDMDKGKQILSQITQIIDNTKQFLKFALDYTPSAKALFEQQKSLLKNLKHNKVQNVVTESRKQRQLIRGETE